MGLVSLSWYLKSHITFLSFSSTYVCTHILLYISLLISFIAYLATKGGLRSFYFCSTFFIQMKVIRLSIVRPCASMLYVNSRFYSVPCCKMNWHWMLKNWLIISLLHFLLALYLNKPSISSPRSWMIISASEWTIIQWR